MRKPARQDFGPTTGVYFRYGQSRLPSTMDVVCYDCETSGTDVRHGQIYQFGCVFAGQDLVETDTAEVRIRRLPYVVPSPGALTVTGLTLDEIDGADRHEEYEGAIEIARHLGFPPGIRRRLYLTFNGIKYDDKLIETTLDRNLRDSRYLTHPREQGRPFRDTQKILQAHRIDMLPVIQLASVMAPDAIRLPTRDDGKASMRLADVAEANAIPIRAHDALGDARATLALARLVRDRAPAVWEAVRRTTNVNKARAHLNAEVDAERPIWLYRHFGKGEVVPCLVVRQKPNKFFLADLNMLDEPLPEGLEPNGLKGLMGRGGHVHHLKFIDAPYLLTAAEAAPIAPPYAVPMAEEAMARVRDGVYAERLAELRRRIDGDAYADFPNATPEELAHKNYWLSDADKGRLDRFCAAPDWESRAGIEFECPRLRDYAARLVAMRCDLDALARGSRGREGLKPERIAQIRRDAAAALARPYAEGDVRWLTAAAACASEEADEAYREWAATAYDPTQGRVGVVPPADPEPPQAAFRF